MFRTDWSRSMMAVFFADVVGQAADVEHPVATGAETELRLIRSLATPL